MTIIFGDKQMSTATQAYQSKWGYHPVSFEGFMKLKEDHKLVLKAYQDIKRYIRWERKDPHNRPTKEAPVADVELIERKGYTTLTERTFAGPHFVNGEPGRRNFYLEVLDAYRASRKPKESPEEVSPLRLPKNYDSVMEEIRKFYL